MSGIPEIDFDDLPPSLLVYGNEPYFRTRFLAQLRDDCRGKVEIEDVWCDADTKSGKVEMVLDQNMAWGGEEQPRVVFVWDFQKIKDRDKRLLPYFDNPSPDTMAVFVMSEGTRAGGPLIKHLKSALAFESPRLEVDRYNKFDNISPWIVAHFKLHGFQISECDAQELHQRVGGSFGKERVKAGDLFMLESEMRRIMTYVGKRREVTKVDVEMVVEEKTDADPFSLTDALLRQNVEKAMQTVHDLFTLMAVDQNKSASDVSIATLGALFKSFQRWFQIVAMRKGGKWDFERIARDVGLPVWVVEKKIWPYAKKHRLGTLARLMSRVCRVDYLIKKGAVDGQTQIELIVLEACGRIKRSLPVYPL